MYDVYKAWCVANAERYWKEKSFAQALSERNMRKEMKRVRVNIDVRLEGVPEFIIDSPPPSQGMGDYGD